ncbi:hypothetical protein PVW48_01675 [Dinoroseobacter sp. PD6]|uniref:hypothetical protein n=1 Tax=Dinoroseobacter sp. PD6 TaxID=3028384 RepID=UPI00237BD0E0|nr:hypothetical protein [Dinoroseobacter sp. PD6]MDD9715439.1 hypothetical protein [Dinoroseobacter sp. PD6]
MNVNQLINMALRIFARKAMTKGVNAGVKRMAARGKTPGQPASPAQQRAARETQRKAQQGLNIARRFTKF